MTRLRNLEKNGKTGISARRSAGFRAGFRKEEDGSLIIFGLFIFVLMLMIGGLGVDLMRYEAQRTRLQSTLDRAVLAAASMSQPLPPKDVVIDYFAKAGLSKYLDPDDIVVEDFLTSRRVTVSATMEVDSTFLNLMGITRLDAPGNGAAEESASQTEISLVVDVSGSMGWSSASGNSKIYELRQAAKQFVNIMQCDPSDPFKTTGCTVEPGKVSISLIPYSEQVVVGNQLLMQFNPTMEHTYSSCVTFAPTDFDTTSITPTQVLQRTGNFDPWSNSDTARDYRRTCRGESSEAWREIFPLGGTAAALRTRIDALGASGNTSIDLGMKWGSAFLDPAAQPVVAAQVARNKIISDFDDRPLDWDERGIEKVIVLMTDGVNTNQHYLYPAFRDGLSPIWRNGSRYSVYRASTDMYYWPWEKSWQRWQDHPYGNGTFWYCRYSWGGGCYWKDEPGVAEQLTFPELWKRRSWEFWEDYSWLPEQGSRYGNGTKNARLLAMCAAAKAQDITIFTIGFETTSASSDVMRNCATSPAHHFDVDGLDLAEAFSAIAREISKLRLVN